MYNIYTEKKREEEAQHLQKIRESCSPIHFKLKRLDSRKPFVHTSDGLATKNKRHLVQFTTEGQTQPENHKDFTLMILDDEDGLKPANPYNYDADRDLGKQSYCSYKELRIVQQHPYFEVEPEQKRTALTFAGNSRVRS